MLEKKEVIGQEVIGQEVIGQEVIGQEVIGQEVIGQEVIGQEVIGQEVIGQEVIGQEQVKGQAHQEQPQQVAQAVEKCLEAKEAHYFNTMSLPFNDRQREGYHLQFNKARLLEQLSLMSLK